MGNASHDDAKITEHARLIKSGGLLMIVAGLLVLATIPLIPLLIPSLASSSAAAGLQSLQSQGTLYSVTWVLYLVSDLLYAVVFVALYFALRSINRTAMLVGVIFTFVFVAIDVALDIPLRLYLVLLSSSYGACGLGCASVLAAAQSTMDASNLVALVATLFQFSAVIIASYVMLKSGKFRKGVAYIGIVCGIVAILFIPAFVAGGSQLAGLFNIGGFVLLVIWSVGTGFMLRKLGRTRV